MHVEDVSWVSLAAWWTPGEKRHLAIGPCLLRKVVIYHQGILALMHKIFTDGAPSVRREEPQRRRRGRRRGNDHGIFHRARFGERVDDLRDLRFFLADRDINADGAGISGLFTLVDYRVDDNRAFTNLPVADDELPLSAADGDHRINGLDAGVERSVYGLAGGNARSDTVHRV